MAQPNLSLPGRVLRTTRPAAQLVRGRRDWYRIDAKAGADEAEILIYDEIGFWGITASDFVRDLNTVTAEKITLRINSPGGEVFDGIAIHNALRQHSASVTVKVDSLAASIATVIAMAGDRVEMAKHSTFMIHEPFTLAVGDAEDLRKTSEVLDQLGDTIAAMYAERAGGTTASWRDKMREETWYTDQQAVDAGLADAIAGQSSEAKNSFDLSVFRHPPEDLLQRSPQSGPASQPTKRTIERALRDAGLSQSQAKAVVAGGWDSIEQGDDPRDVDALVLLRDALVAINQ